MKLWNLGNYTFDEVHAVAQNIDGWMLPDEAKLLYDTAKSLTGKGAMVEIGSWCSKSLTYTSSGALSSANNCKKISIDPFLTSKDEPNGMYEVFISNLKKTGLYDKIIHIKEKSQVAGESFNEDIEFLFIDGFHQYEAVKKDYELFFNHVIEGGFIAIHDVTYYDGPTRLIKELAQEANNLKLVDFSCVTVLAQKTSKLTEEDKAKNQKIIQSVESINNMRQDFSMIQ